MKKLGIVLAMSVGLLLVACKDQNPAVDPTVTPTTDSTQDNRVMVVYNGTSAAVTVSQNILSKITVLQSGAHVSITQSDDVADEITYNLSGSSSDGGFYMSGNYKATVELNGLTLTNVSATYSGAAVHVQNGKRIDVKVVTGTTNTLRDASTGSQKGCLYMRQAYRLTPSPLLPAVPSSEQA